MNAKRWAGLSLFLAAVSCKTSGTTSDFVVTHMTPETYSPRPETQEIEVISAKPERPYIEIAKLQGWDAAEGANGQRLMAQMRQQVRALGGDALIDFQLLARGETNTMAVGDATTMIRSGAINAFGVVVRWKE